MEEELARSTLNKNDIVERACETADVGDASFTRLSRAAKERATEASSSGRSQSIGPVHGVLCRQGSGSESRSLCDGARSEARPARARQTPPVGLRKARNGTPGSLALSRTSVTLVVEERTGRRYSLSGNRFHAARTKQKTRLRRKGLSTL